jgi:hypothetical protein
MFRSLDLTLSPLRYDANLRLFARLHDDDTALQEYPSNDY